MIRVHIRNEKRKNKLVCILTAVCCIFTRRICSKSICCTEQCEYWLP